MAGGIEEAGGGCERRSNASTQRRKSRCRPAKGAWTAGRRFKPGLDPMSEQSAVRRSRYPASYPRLVTLRARPLGAARNYFRPIRENFASFRRVFVRLPGCDCGQAVAATAHGGHVPGGGRSPRGKNETCGAAELIWRCCRANRQKRAAISRGNKMATIPMIPVGPVTTLDRSILRTERRMPGTGGDDFICGHCGYVILEDFDPSMVRGNPVYQCAYCENNNDLRFAVTDRRY